MNRVRPIYGDAMKNTMNRIMVSKFYEKWQNYTTWALS